MIGQPTASAPSGDADGGGGLTGTTATFVERDTTTIGNWAGRHGSAGAVTDSSSNIQTTYRLL